jgi:hypothetical protein
MRGFTVLWRSCKTHYTSRPRKPHTAADVRVKTPGDERRKKKKKKKLVSMHL